MARRTRDSDVALLPLVTSSRASALLEVHDTDDTLRLWVKDQAHALSESACR